MGGRVRPWIGTSFDGTDGAFAYVSVSSLQMRSFGPVVVGPYEVRHSLKLMDLLLSPQALH